MAKTLAICIGWICTLGATDPCSATETWQSHLFRDAVEMWFPGTWESRLEGPWILSLLKGSATVDGGIDALSADIRAEVHFLDGSISTPAYECPMFEESDGQVEMAPEAFATHKFLTCRVGQYFVAVSLRFWPYDPDASTYEGVARSMIQSSRLVGD